MRSLRAALYPLRLVGARLGRRSAPGRPRRARDRRGRVGRPRRTGRSPCRAGPRGRAGGRADPGRPALGPRRLVRRPGAGRRAAARARAARPPRARTGRCRLRDVARPLPREHARRHVRGPRRSRRSRPLGDIALGPAATHLLAGALRGRAAAGPGPAAAARRAEARRGGRGGARQPHALRRLPRAHRQRARRGRGEPIARAGGGIPPAAAATALPCRGRHRTGRVAVARSRLPQLRLGDAARAGPPAPVGGRRSRRGGDGRALRAAGRLVELRPGRARRGAARGAGDEPCGGAAARHRRRRGGSAPLRLRAARGDDASAGPARRPPTARLVRRARLAARARDRRRVGRPRTRRDGDRARRRAARRRRRGPACRGAGGGRARAQRALGRGSRARGSSSPPPRRPSSSAPSACVRRERGSGCSTPRRWLPPRSSSSR